MEPLIGFVIALVVGMTGQGGGPLTAPVLILMLGIPAAEAVGTAMLYITVIKLCASPVFMFRGHVDWTVLKRLLLGGIPGVVLGSLLITKLVKDNLQNVVLLLVGLTVALVSLVNLYKLLRTPEMVERRDRSSILPFLTFPIGLEVGFSSAGAGALGGVAMMQFTTLETATLVGTDLLFGLGLSLVGGGMHIAFGQVNAGLALKLIAGGVVGAVLGAWLSGWMPSRKLRFGLTGLLIFLGGQLAWRGVAGIIPGMLR